MNKTQSYISLLRHYQEFANVPMAKLFAADPDRFSKFSLEAAGIFLDYSKNRITSITMQLLLKLVDELNLHTRVEEMFTGKIINTTERRAVLHTALRNEGHDPIWLNGKDIMQEVHASLNRFLECAEKIRNGKWLGYTGMPITDIVNIGIGGSDLGPAMVTEALSPYNNTNIKCHFVSNIDGTHIARALKDLNPETTLFIVASKTFTTQETLTNAATAKSWLVLKSGTEKAVKSHFIGITASPAKAEEFSILSENIFPFWDWVGGRYSLWSAIGLPIAIAIGADNFRDFLAGAFAMDQHFRNTSYAQNMPVILALLGIWNINFFNAKTLAILPYDQYLSLLPAYLQQLDMESNGKRVDFQGQELDCNTAPVLWGMPGTNGQHAFHQLLMQGTQMIPVDFIFPLQSHHPLGEHHLLLAANCFAQSQALMLGKSLTEIQQELIAQGITTEQAAVLAPHKVIPGDIPSNTLILSKITPHTLGALIALYEHKVFVQGVLWGINSFDQWGVELGKKLAKNIIPSLQKENSFFAEQYDSSTAGLIKLYRSKNYE